MCRVAGFALFFVAVGMILTFFLSDFGTFLVLVFLLVLSYILFCKY